MAQILLLILLSDYAVQKARFQVFTGFGCTDDTDGSGLSLLLINSWTVIPPLFSITVYYRTSGNRTSIA